MEFTEHAIPPELAPLIDGVWSLSSNGEPAPPDAGLVTPDGCVELVVSLDGPAVQMTDVCPHTSNQLDSFVMGLATGPQRFRYRGSVNLVGVRLRLGGALRLLGTNLADLTDRVVPLDDVLPNLANQIRQAVSGTRCAVSDSSGVVDVVSNALDAPRRGSDERIGRVVAALSDTDGGACIATAAHRAGISVRHFDRCFERWFGLSPKRFCRIARFRAAWTLALTEPQFGWAAIAACCGYADQAHLCREFREFAGLSPGKARSFG